MPSTAQKHDGSVKTDHEPVNTPTGFYAETAQIDPPAVEAPRDISPAFAQQVEAVLPDIRAKRTALLADVHAAQAAGDTDAYGAALARLNDWIGGLGSGPVAHPTANSGRWQQPSGGYLYGWTLGD